jgi:hypothetical protein
MPKDTDGTNWMTVRYTIEIPVMAETEEEALYHADLARQDYDWNYGFAEVVKEGE